MTSTTFPNLTGTASNLDITPQHITFDNASVTDSSTETLAGILSITDPSVTVSNFDYEFGPNTIAGAITVTAATASLFASSGSSSQNAPFTATVNELSGTYDFTNQSLSLEAQGLTLGFGQFLTATATNPSFTYDPGGTVPFEISAGTVSLTSPTFPHAQATSSNLDITPQHITLGGATLTDTATEQLGPLEIVQPSITVSNIDYEAAGNTFAAGGITFSASEVALFSDPSSANPPPFSTKVDGFNVSYVFNTQTLSLSATDAEINFGTALTITATAPTLTLVTPPGGPVSVNVSVTSAVVNVPELHLEGQIQNLSITNDGFNVGSASLTLTDSKPITFGPVSIHDPSLTLTNFGYSLSDGASFNSSLGVGIGAADLNVGSSTSTSTISVQATGINATISLAPADAGHFTFTADSVKAAFGSYLTLQAVASATQPAITFDTAATDGYIAQIGTLQATLTAGGITIGGSASNFDITADGTLDTSQGFGVVAQRQRPERDRVDIPASELAAVQHHQARPDLARHQRRPG